MSVTTTENQTYYNTLNILADYELHHSRQPDQSAPSATAASAAAPPPNANVHPNPAGHHNPDDWPTDRRRIPPYRPVEGPARDLSTRRVYLNQAERVFVTLMFLGVWTNGSAAQLWRRTGGKLWNIQYKIGGEF